MGRSSIEPQKPALSLFLSTLRLKLLEDSSLDTEVDPGRDSSATDGKGEEFHSCPLQMHAPVCQAHLLLHALLFPVHQWDSILVNLGILPAWGEKTLQHQEVESVTTTRSLMNPVAFSFPPGPCAEVLAQQRAATTHLLQVLEDLEQAHEEFQKRG